MELLVVIADKHPSDRTHHLRGDVIVACPDGHRWGTEERANPDWMILTVADLEADEALMLTVEQPPLTLAPNERLHRRAFALDLAQLASFARLDRPVPVEQLRGAIISRPYL